MCSSENTNSVLSNYDELNIELLIQNIFDIKKQIENSINLLNYKKTPKCVLFTGDTGGGKSTIITHLMGNKLTIIADKDSEGKSKGKRLDCKNSSIRHGTNSGTKMPDVIFDKRINTIYVDCPGLNDTRGSEQEILNAISINEVIKNAVKKNIKIKVIFVAQKDDFQTNRQNYVIDQFERIKNMFPNIENVGEKMALIITKASSNSSKEKYVNEESKLSRDFTKDRIFMFPKPSECSGTYKNFDEKQKLINFITDDDHFIENPMPSIQLNYEALSLINKTKSHLITSLNKKIENYFQDYQMQCKNSSISKINDLLDHLLFLKSNQNQINNIIDFVQLCLKNTDIVKKLKNNLQDIENYHSIILFIKEISDAKGIQESFKEKVISSIETLIENIKLIIKLKTKRLNKKCSQVHRPLFDNFFF